MSAHPSAIPAPVRLPGKPWFPPADFARLAEHFQPDDKWIALLRGVHYQRGHGLMREHLRRWARQQHWDVEIESIRDMLALRQMQHGSELVLQLEDAGIDLTAVKSPGMSLRFRESATSGSTA